MNNLPVGLCRLSTRASGKSGIFLATALAFFCILIPACGPKDIGSGITAEDYHISTSPTAAEQMRFPMLGAGPTQRRLYYYNRPDVMENTQRWRVQEFNRLHGTRSESKPEESEGTPRQLSPFGK